MKTITLISLAAVGTGSLVVGVNYLVKKKEKKTQDEFLAQLELLLNPKSKGLISEAAFDIDLLDQLRGTTAKTILVLKPEVAKRTAKQIKQTWGSWWSGDAEMRKVKGILSSLGDKVKISQVAKAYLNEYKISLTDAIKRELNDGQITELLGAVRPLKTMKTL